MKDLRGRKDATVAGGEDRDRPPLQDFPLEEAVLMKRLGVSREQMREARGTLPAGDWADKKGVRYTKAGGLALARHFGVEETVALGVKGLLYPPAGHVIQVKAWRGVVNQTLLECWVGGDAYEVVNRLIVRVGDNRNFTRGMTLKVVRTGKDGWELVGRPPRARGRW